MSTSSSDPPAQPAQPSKKRRLNRSAPHPALSKPFKSPLRQQPSTSSTPSVPPASTAKAKELHADIATLEQALQLLTGAHPDNNDGHTDNDDSGGGDDPPVPRADRRLAQLTLKWRDAGRRAADALLADTAGQVRDMGGWSAARRRWADEARTRAAEDAEGERDGDKRDGDDEGDGEGGDEGDDGVAEEGFGMGILLRTLHVDAGVLGWDEDGQCWRE